MNVQQYLNRINYQGSLTPDINTLRQLHRCHLYTVPFENFDIHLGIPIELDVQASFNKIVKNNRGGFCYELNGLFGWLLRELGFQVELLSARVFKDGKPGKAYAHVLLSINLGKGYIADVGFGDAFIDPVKLNDDHLNSDDKSGFRICQSSDNLVLQACKSSNWESQYLFSLNPREYREFDNMCQYQQSSPESHFTQGIICSLATLQGRITLSNNRFIQATHEGQVINVIDDSEKFYSILESRFCIRLPKQKIKRLFQSAINL